jgi:hypothetical protein
MAQREGNGKSRSAADRGHLDRLADLERLLESALSALPDRPSSADCNPEISIDALGRAHQVQPPRSTADSRRVKTGRTQLLFAR